MKKISVLVMILLSIIIVGGCTKNSFNSDEAKKIIEDNISDLKEISDETLEDVYSMDLSEMKEYTFKQNKDGDFYAIIKTDNVDGVKASMNDYFEKVQKFNTNYSPERIEILDNRVEKEIDDYLVYIVSKDADDIYNKIIENM